MLTRRAIQSAAWIGFEVSTTKARVQVFDEEGLSIWCRYVGIPRRKKGYRITQRPSLWLEEFSHLLDAARADGVTFNALRGIGVTSTTPSMIPVRADGEPLTDEAVLWCDPRAVGRATATNSGLRKAAHLCFSGEEAESFGKADRLADAGPFIVRRLTDRLVSGAAMLAQKFGWKGIGFEFDVDGLEELGPAGCDALLARIPPTVVETGEVVGELTPRAAAETRLPRGVPVALCGYDSVCGVVGGNVWKPCDVAVLSLGTSAVVYKSPIGRSPWGAVDHLLPDRYPLTSGGFEAGVQSIDLLHRDFKLTCSSASDAELERIAREGEAECNARYLSLPFGGVPLRAPHPGLVLDTTVYAPCIMPSPAEILTAMRRGIACFLAYCLADLEHHGEHVESVRLIGGGTRSLSFCQLVADCVRRPVRRFDGSTAAIGAVLCTVHTLEGSERARSIGQRVLDGSGLHLPTECPQRRALYGQLVDLFRQRLRNELALTNSALARRAAR